MDLSIIIPTYNEKSNIKPLIESVEKALSGLDWELVFVDDDSPDGTADEVKQISTENSSVRCIRRVGRRGLSSAAIEGFLSSSAEFIALMDADLQHDESLLQQMYELLKCNGHDMVIGSRYIEGGKANTGLSPLRLFASKAANHLGNIVLKTHVSDPMSGYFMMRRQVFECQAHKLSGQGFKILLDIVSSMQGLKIKELPYEMRQRNTGNSKLEMMVVSEYYMLLLDKLFGRFIPVRFLMFVTVGLMGVVVHFISLYILFTVLLFPFIYAQAVGTVLAMTSNFLINNGFTYRDVRLTGFRLLSGLLTFYVACGLGAAINIGISSYLYTHEINWAIAGLTGAIIGAVWNYSMTATFTWTRKKRV